MQRSKPDLKCITDKKHWTQPELSRSSSQNKARISMKSSEAHRCDTPDQGGGKPGYSVSKYLRPYISYNTRAKSRQGGRPQAYCVDGGMMFLSGNSEKNSKSSRSKSSKKFCPVDLKKGIFSKKQSTSTERIVKKVPVVPIANDWKVEIRSPSPSSIGPNDISHEHSESPKIQPRSTPVSIQKIENAPYIPLWKIYLHEIGNK